MTEPARKTDLSLAIAALKAKERRYQRLFAYYDGEHPLVYTNRRLEDVFKNLDARFVENWCAVVIDAVADRIAMSGWACDDKQARLALETLWTDLELALEADDIHKAALVCGEAFLMVWPDEQDENTIQAYYNAPWLCHVVYEAENPRKPRFAAKWWDDDDGRRRLTLYYPDRLEYYISRGKAQNASSERSYVAQGLGQAANPYGRVPVFHFRAERRAIKSDLGDVIPVQNGINKLLMDMMVAAEYGAFKQRFVVSNGDTAALRNAPNEVWEIPANDGQGESTQVGEFSATELDNYLRAINQLATAIGAITRTPKHYFYQQGGDPSGEALIALEAPLNKKTQDRIDRFAPVWRNVGAFLLQIQNMAIEPRTLRPVFARPETTQPYTRALTRKTNKEAGVPIRTQLRDEGWTETQLSQMDEDRRAEMGGIREGTAPPQPALASLSGPTSTRAGRSQNGREAQE